MTANKKTLYIFRHGETDWNRDKIMQGWADIPLNDTGRAQASALREKLSGIQIDVIYSSPLSRALETAKIALPDVPVQLIDNLREQNMGALQGHRIHLTTNADEVDMNLENHQLVLLESEIRDPDYVLPGGESENEFIARVRIALDTILKSSAGGNIAISTHAGVAWVIMTQIVAPNEKYSTLQNADYICIEYNGVKFKVL